jgi:hypothetical protein
MTRPKFKAAFFDKVIQDKVTPATFRALARFGALVRTKARRSIRKRKKSSKPGEAPSSHNGQLRNNIFFAYEPNRGGVVIGPSARRMSGSGGGIVTKQLATETLEYGGKVGVVETRHKSGKWLSTGGRRIKGTGGRRRVRWVKVKPRPYMGPAFDSTAPLASTFWRNSIKG